MFLTSRPARRDLIGSMRIPAAA